MTSDSNTNKYDYMQGRDYIDALFVGKYFILAIVFISVAITAIYSYSYVLRNTVSVVVKPGLFVWDGTIIAVITPQGLSHIIDEGFLNGLIQQTLKTDSERPIKFNSYIPQDTGAVKITYETNNAYNGLKILNELVAQLLIYYEKERVLQQTVSYKFIDGLKSRLLADELSEMKKTDEKRNLIHEKSLLVKALVEAQQDKGKIEEQIKGKEKEINEKQKEIGTLNFDIITLRKQIISFDEILKHKMSLQVIQEPMIISNNFTQKFILNIFTIGVLSLLFAILIQFVIYDLKLGRKQRI